MCRGACAWNPEARARLCRMLLSSPTQRRSQVTWAAVTPGSRRAAENRKRRGSRYRPDGTGPKPPHGVATQPPAKPILPETAREGAHLHEGDEE